MIIFDRHVPADSTSLDLSELLEESVIQLRKEVPQELVVKMFQKMVGKVRLSHSHII